ncbi:MAG: arylsulfatase [Phycisphaerae bacterium]|nr:arylsulfatase [Phycisphaerae bacterium]
MLSRTVFHLLGGRSAALYVITFVGLLAMAAAASAAERPNILIVLTDDMGFSDLGCFGGEIETPNLDALAANGLRFTEFHNTARCWPTRATLMSGVYSSGLSDQQVTIAEVLKPAGYQTAMVGKWHLGDNPLKNGPIQRGFDHFYGTLGGAGSYWKPPALTRNTEFVAPDGQDFYYTDRIGEEAVKQIEAFATDDKPFFQYVAFTAAHWPLHAPEKTVQKYIERYQGGWEQLRKDRYARMLKMGIIDRDRWPLPPMEPGVAPWDSVDDKAWHIRNMAVYAAMVDHMDRAVGRIVAALKRTEQLDNTLIVYMHDNGACSEHLSDNGWGTATNVQAWARENNKTIAIGDQVDVPMGGPLTYGSVGHNWANAQNTPLRRYKSNVHEGGACTPCIMHWPARMTYRGQITRQRGHLVDLMATCMELADAAYPLEVGGKPIARHESLSLVPVITGGQQARDHVYYFNHSNTQAVIRGDWKVVRERKGPWHLYNLSENRTETEDQSGNHPEIVEALTSLHENWMKRQETLPRPMQ